MECDRSGISFSRVLWPRFQPISSYCHVSSESNVRYIIFDGVRSDSGLPIIPSSVWTLGYNYWRFDERFSEVPRCSEHFRVWVFYANCRNEPSYH